MARAAKVPADVDSEPYTPAQIARLLRVMSDGELAATSPRKFQMWPVRKIVSAPAIAELIANETASRRSA